MNEHGLILNLSVAAMLLVAGLVGCERGLSSIDRRVNSLIGETTETVGASASPRHIPDEGTMTEVKGEERDPTAEHPGTINPPADLLVFTPAAVKDAADVISRLEAYNDLPTDTSRMDLPAALAYAIRHSREYRFEEEEYILAAMRLLIEHHRWGPRFFDEVSATASAFGDDGLFDTSLDLVNEFRVTQRLPYGGEVSARALARATEDLHQRVSGENVQTAELILDVNGRHPAAVAEQIIETLALN